MTLTQVRASPSDHGPATRTRLVSLDVLRGLAIVILLLAGNPFMREHLPSQLKHPEWHGLRFADLFFPVFLFAVGMAMTLSRRAGSLPNVLRRVGILALIGVGLSSLKHGTLVVPGVLQHIAVSYLLAWLVLRAPRRAQVPIAGGIVAALWLGFVIWAGPGEDPWSMTDGFAHAVNGWFFGNFATEGVPQAVASTVTVLGGAFVGRAVKERAHPGGTNSRVEPQAGRLQEIGGLSRWVALQAASMRGGPGALSRWVALQAAWLTGAGLLLALEVPINKRIWSPSYTLLTLGISCALFAFFVWSVDVRDNRRWVEPMRVLGMNPIAIYVGFITVRALLSPFADAAPDLAPLGSETAGALTYSLGWLLAGWAAAHLLHRRRIYLRI